MKPPFGGSCFEQTVSLPTFPLNSYPPSFPPSGNWTEPLYAVSVSGTIASTCITWFQAEQACRLSGKRLLTNQEWQAAAAGTPDPGVDDGSTSCNYYDEQGAQLTPTGSRSACVSRWGAFDMVSNVAEWVADWVPYSTACANWVTQYSGFSTQDKMCLAGAHETFGPGALVRGGGANEEGDENDDPGVFSIGDSYPPIPGNFIGFRCGRPL